MIPKETAEDEHPYSLKSDEIRYINRITSIP